MPDEREPLPVPSNPSPGSQGSTRVRVRVRKSVRKKELTTRHRRKRRIVIALAIVGAVAALLVLDGIYSAVSLYRGVREAQDDLKTGSQLLVHGDVPGATSSFASAEDAASKANGAANHPAVLLASLLPGAGDNVDAVRDASHAMLDAADAATHLASAAQAAGWNGSSVPGFGSDGSIDAGVIAAAVPDLQTAASKLGEARSTMDAIPLDGLSPLVKPKITEGKTLVAEGADESQNLSDAATLLAGFLGANGPRTYLLVQMSTADPRGGGGYPGSYALVHTDGTSIQLDRLAPTSEIPVLPKDQAVEASPDVVARYAPFGATTHFISTTYSPDFPTDAKLMKGIWEAGGGSPLDGVIVADSQGIATFLRAMGTTLSDPVHGPNFPATISADNVQQVMDRDSLLTLSKPLSDRWQGLIGNALWNAVLGGPWTPSVGTAAADATQKRHLMIYSSDSAEQARLERLGAAGTLEVNPDEPYVTFSGYVDNRAAYYVTKDVKQTSKPLADGSGKAVTVTVTLKNHAPSKPPSISIGDKTLFYPLGTFGAVVDLFLPMGATDPLAKVKQTAPVAAGPGGQELGYQVISTTMQVSPGETAVGTFTYRMPG